MNEAASEAVSKPARRLSAADISSGLALAVSVFPFNTHLAAYSTFWGGVLLLLAALYAGSLLGRNTT